MVSDRQVWPEELLYGSPLVPGMSVVGLSTRKECEEHADYSHKEDESCQGEAQALAGPVPAWPQCP